MKKYYFILSLVILSAFVFPKKIVPIFFSDNIVVTGKLFTSLYQQHAAEYKALCYQAYNIARLRVDESLQKVHSKQRAIIIDIDETIFDNSPYAVYRALQGEEYDITSWHDWTNRSQCDTLAGALSFLKYAASKKIEVFYITNRDAKEISGTLKNLQYYKFPNADNEHLLVKETTSSKESRRQKVSSSFNIILLLGDNLADFNSLFDNKSTEERARVTQQISAAFGKNYILLPNPNYGDWENALYKYNYKLSLAQKDSIIKSKLKNYE